MPFACTSYRVAGPYPGTSIALPVLVVSRSSQETRPSTASWTRPTLSMLSKVRATIATSELWDLTWKTASKIGSRSNASFVATPGQRRSSMDCVLNRVKLRREVGSYSPRSISKMNSGLSRSFAAIVVTGAAGSSSADPLESPKANGFSGTAGGSSEATASGIGAGPTPRSTTSPSQPRSGSVLTSDWVHDVATRAVITSPTTVVLNLLILRISTPNSRRFIGRWP